MGKPTGFLELDRQDRTYLPKEERVQSFREFVVPMDESGFESASLTLHGLRRALLP